MKTQHRLLATALVATTVMAGAMSAHAQSSSSANSTTGSGATQATQNNPAGATRADDASGRQTGRFGMSDENSSLLPYTTHGYVGASIGKPDYGTRCGLIGSCDNPDVSGHIYTGGMFSRYLGAEVGYVYMGEAKRGGGETRAHGINLSLVGQVPIANSFNAFAKVGTTYGRTRTSALPGAGITTGNDGGWGWAYGAGLSYDFNRNVSAVLDWQRHDFVFAGDSRKHVESTKIGLKDNF
ncbi:MAG: outer membrane beta-barrel protein [Betaproteobacteria bacterium]